MPAGDGTGPRGEGPLTGRAMGRCAGYSDGGYATAPGRGGGYGCYGRRVGGGRGFRNRFYETGLPYWRRLPREQEPAFRPAPTETESLRGQIQFVSDTIERLADRVEQLLRRKKETE
ncbi:MAG: DUF5320 domain-containing protein [Candidatus Aegiribacteria sp.]